MTLSAYPYPDAADPQFQAVDVLCVQVQAGSASPAHLVQMLRAARVESARVFACYRSALLESLTASSNGRALGD